MTKEIWKDISGYEEFFQVSNLGRVKSLDRKVLSKNGRIYKLKGKIKSLQKSGSGYLQVNLKKEGGSKIKQVHRLVAETFIDNPENKVQVNHIDGDKYNNQITNLEWVSAKENQIHSIRNNLRSSWVGTENISNKLFPEEVIEIRRRYSLGGVTQKELARIYNISSSQISNIIRRKLWKHLD